MTSRDWWLRARRALPAQYELRFCTAVDQRHLCRGILSQSAGCGVHGWKAIEEIRRRPR